jgi:hypothetical protein
MEIATKKQRQTPEKNAAHPALVAECALCHERGAAFFRLQSITFDSNRTQSIPGE